ncbi:MAG: photosystem II assembly protein Psb34 [Pseudanabaena sp.]
MNTIELKETMTSDNIQPSSDTSSPQASSNSSSDEIKALRSCTVEGGGVLNNFAVMPKMYIEEPDAVKTENFTFQIVGLIVLVIAMIGIAIAVS